jgi:hypothetical protein
MEPNPYEAPVELNDDSSIPTLPSTIPDEFFVGMQRWFSFTFCVLATVAALWLLAKMFAG